VYNSWSIAWFVEISSNNYLIERFSNTVITLSSAYESISAFAPSSCSCNSAFDWYNSFLTSAALSFAILSEILMSNDAFAVYQLFNLLVYSVLSIVTEESSYILSVFKNKSDKLLNAVASFL